MRRNRHLECFQSTPLPLPDSIRTLNADGVIKVAASDSFLTLKAALLLIETYQNVSNLRLREMQ